jgi:hypothetical protein
LFSRPIKTLDDLFVHTPSRPPARPHGRGAADRAGGLALVTAAIALWNTVYLGRGLDALRLRGDVVRDALLVHLAPLGWQHINLTGDYLWGADSNVGADGFRPLRTTSPMAPISAAA